TSLETCDAGRYGLDELDAQLGGHRSGASGQAGRHHSAATYIGQYREAGRDQCSVLAAQVIRRGQSGDELARSHIEDGDAEGPVQRDRKPTRGPTGARKRFVARQRVGSHHVTRRPVGTTWNISPMPSTSSSGVTARADLLTYSPARLQPTSRWIRLP